MRGLRTIGAALAAALAIVLVTIVPTTAARALPLADTRASTDAGAGDVGDGGAAGDAPSADAVPTLREADAEPLREELRSMRAFAAGKLAKIRSRDLFGVDLSDDAAVAQRSEQVSKELAIARSLAQALVAAADAGAPREPDANADAGPGVDAGAKATSSSEETRLFTEPPTDHVIALLRVRTLEAASRVLAKPKAEREQLLAAELAAVQADLVERERNLAKDEAESAEQARRQALADAQSARSKMERDLAQLRAGVETVRADQIRHRATLSERRRAAKLLEDELAEMRASIDIRAHQAEPGSPEADALFDVVVDDLIQLAAQAHTLLGEAETRVRVPRPVATIPVVTDPELTSTREKLKSERDALEAAAIAMDEERLDLVWSSLRSTVKTEKQLNELRIELLGRVSKDKRERVLGFGAEGRQQLARELSRLDLEVRWLRTSGWEGLRERWNALRGPAAIGQLSLDVLGALFVLWTTLFVRRRLERWILAANAALARAVRRSAVIRASQRIGNIAIAIGREVVTLLGVIALRRVVPIDWAHSAWSVPYTLLLWYAIYRLALNATYQTLAWAAARSEAGTAIAPKILRSVRVSMRFAFAVAVVLAGAAAVLGRGCLYTLVVRVGWLGGLVITYVLMRWWRDDITRSFNRMRPTGGLARLVEGTRDRWVGFFVTIAAFVVLFFTALVRATRRFILNFDHSRKALAYMFRRRLERQGELHATVEPPRLSQNTLGFFTEHPPEDDALLLERFPGMAEWMRGVSRWDQGAPVGATLVVGRSGYGKSSWLREAKRRAGARPFVSVSIVDRAPTEESVVVTLAKALGHDGVNDLAELAAAIAHGPRRIIAVDDAHLWFMRGVGTLDAWHAFAAIVERTSDTILWVASFAHYPWEFVSWITKGDIVFRTVVSIPPWTEVEIGELIEKRTKASGIEVAYDDLITEDADMIDGADTRARVLSTARDYNRLIWDYAEGSPRVAMHVWQRSLVPDGPGRARVRLFGSPETAWLDELSESAKFVLAAMVWHEQLAAREASAVLRIPRGICEDTFDHLLGKGVADPFHGGRARITPLWWPQVVRYLRRKHLIDS